MLITTIEINDKITSIKKDSALKFTLECGDAITLETFHDQDCCESVYADFEYFNDARLDSNNIVKNIEIKGVDGHGLLLIFNLGDYSYIPVKEFIPCYNEQNGYYSSAIELIVKKNDEVIGKFNVSEYKDDIIF